MVAKPSCADPVKCVDALKIKVAELKRCKKALASIASERSAQLGEKFFQAMVMQLAAILQADYTLIGLIHDQHHSRVKTIALCADGKIADNIEYELAGKPCENVVGLKTCAYPSQVADRFPEDALLADMKVQGYVGIPLFDSRKQPLGHMAVLFRSPLDDVEFAKSILQICAARTAAEIECLLTRKALKESEARYRSLAENTPDVITRFDREGRHLYVNPYLSKAVPLKPGDFSGKTHRDLGFPADRCHFWGQKIKMVFDRGRPHESDFDFEGPKGMISCKWRLIPEFDDSGEVASVLSMARDVTERKKTERKYRTLFNQMQEGFALHEMVYDTDGNAVDYRFLTVNPAFEHLTGLSRESIVGRTVLEVLPNTESFWIEAGGQVPKAANLADLKIFQVN